MSPEYDEKATHAVRAPAADFSADLHKGVKGLRLGIVDDFTFRNVDWEVAKAAQALADQFAKLGAVVKSVTIPRLSAKIDFKYPLTNLIYKQILGDSYRGAENKALSGPVVHANMPQAEKISKEAYAAAVEQRPIEIAEIREVFQDVDAFLTPTHPFAAPPVRV